MGGRSEAATPKFPDDENGEVLRRMFKQGDDLSRPRIIDFCFTFADRRQALAFAEIVDEQDLEVCISVYEERDGWEAIVKRYMVPTHEDITALEVSLTQRAVAVGGEADGWGCMQVNS
jgi:hypothetical protein